MYPARIAAAEWMREFDYTNLDILLTLYINAVLFKRSLILWTNITFDEGRNEICIFSRNTEIG